MALRELPFQCPRQLRSISVARVSNIPSYAQRNYASTPSANASLDAQDLEASSSFHVPPPSDDAVKNYDPIGQAKKRKQQLGRELPPSRYRYRSPKYYRGPLHPHQPPPPSDPTSRAFIPGPFSLPRVLQTWQSTIAPDLLTLSYQHLPPGYQPPPSAPRLRSWDASSPYHKNRPLRGPRGHEVLPLLWKPITPHNIPRLDRVTVHSFVSAAMDNPGALHVARMVVQAITNVRTRTFEAKKSVANWGLRGGKEVSVTAELYGEDMWDFVGKLVDVVMPRIKDWRGVKGSSGDSSGNLSLGLGPGDVQLFPEVEVNYDAYPPKMIPGIYIMLHTTATNDRDARLLLSATGVPFYGKQVN
ncbi:MAG: hypothetical protein M1820_000091 [Bogoriella megaspora]|nr:MAG: hypothetical protein M1820_000091 [Bogoriella megaspora]